MICFIFLLAAPHLECSARPNIKEEGEFQFHLEQILRQNYGIVFDKQPQILQNGYSEFKLYLRIPRIQTPNFPDLERELRCKWVNNMKQKVIENVCTHLQVLQDVYLQTSLVDEAKYMNQAINVQLNDSITAKQADRSVRELFGTVGRLSRGLFGTASIDDVREIYTHVKNLENYVERNQNNEAEFKEVLIMFANLTNDRFNFAATNIRNFSDDIKENRKLLEVLAT